MLKVIITDDHPIVREGLKKILDKSSQMIIVGEAATGEELLNKLKDLACDVVLLDISMPGRGGLEILEQIRMQSPGLPVLVLSMHSEDHYAKRVLQMGAAGYLTKDKAPLELIEAIRKVAGGGKYISHSLAEKLAFDLEQGKDKQPHETLSNREFQVMLLIAEGKTVSEIAEELVLSVRTISTFRSRIMGKMQMKNNSELTHYVIENKIID